MTQKELVRKKITIVQAFYSEFVPKANYVIDKAKLEKKILDTSELVKKSGYNAKISKIEGKAPSIRGLAINAALTALGNKIPDVSMLVRKTDYNT